MTNIDHRYEPPQPSPALSGRLLLEGIILGALYGIILRVGMSFPAVNRWIGAHALSGVTAVMTWAFVVLGPFAIGFLAVSRASARGRVSIAKQLFAPWLSILLMMSVLGLFAWEGAICIIMALPVALVLSSIGGLVAGAFVRFRNPSGITMSCVAILPFILSPLEARLTAPTQTRTVSSEIRIHASAATVWQNIARVPAISPAELQPTWTHRIGFPRPVEATLSHEGVGGVRHATFEHGLLFIETVTAWEPEHRLAFGIHADTAHIPPTTLDEHVTIGGPYFDVLDGEYRIEPLANGDILLHLTSHQRLSTDFNNYAGLWSDAVMQTLQTSILQVIQHRCESAKPSPGS